MCVWTGDDAGKHQCLPQSLCTGCNRAGNRARKGRSALACLYARDKGMRLQERKRPNSEWENKQVCLSLRACLWKGVDDGVLELRDPECARGRSLQARELKGGCVTRWHATEGARLGTCAWVCAYVHVSERL